MNTTGLSGGAKVRVLRWIVVFTRPISEAPQHGRAPPAP
jgi:hypothetical protein